MKSQDTSRANDQAQTARDVRRVRDIEHPRGRSAAGASVAPEVKSHNSWQSHYAVRSRRSIR